VLLAEECHVPNIIAERVDISKQYIAFVKMSLILNEFPEFLDDF
jgi:hypothetical protein